jgi:hypothetical protein
VSAVALDITFLPRITNAIVVGGEWVIRKEYPLDLGVRTDCSDLRLNERSQRWKPERNFDCYAILPKAHCFEKRAVGGPPRCDTLIEYTETAATLANPVTLAGPAKADDELYFGHWGRRVEQVPFLSGGCLYAPSATQIPSDGLRYITGAWSPARCSGTDPVQVKRIL